MSRKGVPEFVIIPNGPIVRFDPTVASFTDTPDGRRFVIRANGDAEPLVFLAGYHEVQSHDGRVKAVAWSQSPVTSTAAAEILRLLPPE